MKNKNKCAFLFVVCFGIILTGLAQHPVDVEAYHFEIELTDQSDAITGKAWIDVRFLEDATEISFDLASIENDKGMYAYQVMENSLPLQAVHVHDVVHITLPKMARKGESHRYEIQYMGTPKDGLIISKNKFGDRTFFADNWPNRAHQWIPCIDRPDDKAAFEFLITTPLQYQVISNGILIKETKIDGYRKLTYWKETIPLPTKVMVIGVAKFAVKEWRDHPMDVPVSAWVYPQDSSRGFYDYAVAPGILTFFSDLIAPFPYKKLANVQSKTIFGGMENASAIFYAEDLVTGDRQSEDVVAHEIVHQWFGDMASEKSFAHLWLSEGFATYLTDLYFEKKYGRDSFVKRLQKERDAVRQFVKTNHHPVIDSTSDLMSLLNANSYQKGAWVLHMLRNEVGDSTFQKLLRVYYSRYAGSNAETRDFQRVAEEVSQKQMQWFFDQWLYQPGIPSLLIEWKGDHKEIKLQVKQLNDQLYRLRLSLLITTKNGSTRMVHYFIEEKETTIKLSLDSEPVSVVADPITVLLYEGIVQEKK